MANLEELFSSNYLDKFASTLELFSWLAKNTSLLEHKDKEQLLQSVVFVGEHIQSHEYKPIMDMYGVDMAQAMYKYFSSIEEYELAAEIIKQITEYQEAESLLPDQFAKECTTHWKAFVNILSLGAPKDMVWRDLLDIHNTLNRLGKITENYMIFPAGGGMPLAGSEFVWEDFCFGLQTKGGGTTYIVKPESLSYAHIDDEGDFSYFLLTLKQQQKIRSDYEDDNNFQQDVRDNGSEYMPIADYNSLDNPAEYFGKARIVSRMLSGQIMIVKKTGVIDRLNTKTGAPNLKMNAEQLREDITKAHEVFFEIKPPQS